jgi:Transposase
MKRSRFSEEQIIAILKEQEAGMTTAAACSSRHQNQNRIPATKLTRLGSSPATRA